MTEDNINFDKLDALTPPSLDFYKFVELDIFQRSRSDILLAMVYASYSKNIPSTKSICRAIEVS